MMRKMKSLKFLFVVLLGAIAVACQPVEEKKEEKTFLPLVNIVSAKKEPSFTR